MRFLLAAEFEATELQHHPAESPGNTLAIGVFKNLADEERVHAGEFLRLLHELDPVEKKLYGKGSEQVEIAIRKMK
jgi:rubrerythrin